MNKTMKITIFAVIAIILLLGLLYYVIDIEPAISKDTYSKINNSRMHGLIPAIKLYQKQKDSLPGSLKDLVTEGYLDKDAMYDCAGKEILYRIEKDGYMLSIDSKEAKMQIFVKTK
jgi:competence protein ComGC